ncbi:hypothetical protein [Bacillus mycoides]|uniref:hypothetical protein n=1 Tax=Bacillus mycoides TaxID=1405 RepID=UPI001C02C829|nr:hypothetical protein [Bacillus mycoides]QWG64979.1 hypothetical protein EXW60_29690 [Bacillus mycoides]QWG93228.1 hypothetical protein EXW40_29915 [Bacillus mycoides]QWJ09358.1 hypothetical protein J5V76_28975 [Bacillus mycoides]
MKKFVQTLLAGIIISSGILFGTSDAFAMGSKGSINFTTDSNDYRKNATSIDVTGIMPYSGGVVELYGKDNGEYRRIDVKDSGRFNVSFSTSGLQSGLYDVKAAADWGSDHPRGELTNYIRVTR